MRLGPSDASPVSATVPLARGSDRLHKLSSVPEIDQSPKPEIDVAKLLARDYWVVQWTPHDSTTAEDIGIHLQAHLAWLFDLEQRETLFLSGPILEGPDVRPGSGITVVRATGSAAASEIAAADPFVIAGLRTFQVFRWRVNEGKISVRLSLGTGTYDWA